MPTPPTFIGSSRWPEPPQIPAQLTVNELIAKLEAMRDTGRGDHQVIATPTNPHSPGWAIRLVMPASVGRADLVALIVTDHAGGCLAYMDGMHRCKECGRAVP